MAGFYSAVDSYSAERRSERRLIGDYEALVVELLSRLGLCPMRGSPRRARGPPVDFGDKLLTQPSWYTFAPPRGRFLLRR